MATREQNTGKWYDDPAELALLLNLTCVKGIGSARLRTLMQKFGRPSRVVRADLQMLARTEGVDSRIAGEIKSAVESDFGAAQLHIAEKQGGELVPFWSRKYPALLRQIPDAPVYYFAKGQVDFSENIAIAVVGTRSPSTYGKQVTGKIVAELVEAGITIVSGLARGIDTIAHGEAVKQGGRTIAVLGSGLDVLYPAENRALHNRILENGAIISEFPFGTKPDAVNFPRRNRIISGLCLGTLIVEAREKSGALITANLALEQNREVFAVPGSIFSPASSGPHQLIREGAKIVGGIEDVLEEIPRQGELFSRREVAMEAEKDLSPAWKKIFGGLSREPKHVDVLSRETGIPLPELLTVLLEMEIAGFVRQMPGKLFVKI